MLRTKPARRSGSGARAFKACAGPPSALGAALRADQEAGPMGQAGHGTSAPGRMRYQEVLQGWKPVTRTGPVG